MLPAEGLGPVFEDTVNRRRDMTISPHNPDLPQTSTGRRIIRIPESRMVEAADRLAGDHGGSDAGSRIVEAAASHGITFEHMWGCESERNGRIGQVCLIAPGAGRVAMAFTSEPKNAHQERELTEVIDAACERLPNLRLVQGLMTPRERRAKAAFLEAGFRQIGGLLYLRRQWRDPAPAPPADWPEGVLVRNWRAGDDEALITALQRSYEGTKDCPELCGLRDGADVLASHHSTGEFDPSLWWIVFERDEPHGALLLNRCPSQGHTELVYLGLSPALRGRGVAQRLLALGFSALAARTERVVTCAVDERNDPARRLYEQHGFRTFARRVAVIRPVNGAVDDGG